MPLLWFCVCAYLMFAVVGLIEAEISVRPGASPSTAQAVATILWFALSHPALSALRWARLQLSR